MFEPTATLTLQTTHPSFIPNLRIRSKPAADWVTECFRNRPPHAHTVRAPFAPMRTVATIGSIMQTYQPTISNHAVGEFSHLDDKSTISFVISLGNDGMVRRFVLKPTAPPPRSALGRAPCALSGRKKTAGELGRRSS